jgi:hypothetical protein
MQKRCLEIEGYSRMDLERRSRLSLKSPNFLMVTDGVIAQVAI